MHADDNRLRIQLEGFEGPLDLLLHLIRKHELDILDIPVAFITEEYLGYIDAMQALDLAVAGEYLVMAATLLHIKSRMLLPKPEVDDDLDGDDDDFDPRGELVRRLLEYQRYRDAADALGHRQICGRDVFARPSRGDRHRAEAGKPDLIPVDLFQLLEAYRRMMRERPVEAMHEITREELTLRDAINHIADHVSANPRTTMIELIYLQSPEPTSAHVVITFLALLEMAKLRLIKLFQSRLSKSELYVERAVLDHEDVALSLDQLQDQPAT